MKSLIVDDEFVSLSKVMALLEPYGPCDAATNGKQALEMYTKTLESINPYDLVTIDIEMPGMHGLMLLRCLCEQEQLKGARPARKIMVSAASSTVNVKQALLHHCDAFLVKPIYREALTEKLVVLKLVAPEPAAAGPGTSQYARS